MCGAFSFVIFIPAVMELAAAAEAGFAFFVCFFGFRQKYPVEKKSSFSYLLRIPWAE